MKKENGVTIMTVVVTIIIMLILAGVTINMVVDTDVIDKAYELDLKTEFSELVDEWYMRRAEINMSGIDDKEINFPNIKEAVIVIGQTEFSEKVIRTVEITDELNKKIAIQEGRIVYYFNECTEEEIKYFESQDVRAYDVVGDFSRIKSKWIAQKAIINSQGITDDEINYSNLKTAKFINASGYQEELFYGVEFNEELNRKIEIVKGKLVYKADKCNQEQIDYFKLQGLQEYNEAL